jgi:hypothetical protein
MDWWIGGLVDWWIGGWTESRCDWVCLRSRHFVARLRPRLASDFVLWVAQGMLAGTQPERFSKKFSTTDGHG